jgi:hypothetical protein
MVKSQTQSGTRQASARSRHFQRELSLLAKGLRRDIATAEDPRFQALLETSAEVLIGIRRAFAHYNAGREKAWNGR